MNWEGLGQTRPSCPPWPFCFRGREITFSCEFLFLFQKSRTPACLGVFPRLNVFPFHLQKVFYANSDKFSRHLAAGGMLRRSTFNVCMERSIVTGVDNYITSYDRLNFHPSYNVSKPSICD